MKNLDQDIYSIATNGRVIAGWSYRRYVLAMVLLTFAGCSTFRKSQPGQYATCEDCFCIPEEGESCPYDRLPRTDFEQIIPTLRSLIHDNPMELKCDPYMDENCELEPPIVSHNIKGGGVCVVDYKYHTNETCPHSYKLQTFDGSVDEAQELGLIVTHAGPCAACSSLQDLAVYMEQGADLRSSSSSCGLRGQFSEADGLSCFKELGFSDACASIWHANTKHTARKCSRHCIPFVISGRGPNKDEPGCPMETCIECDEVHSGPNFKRFSGRTRRNSGLRSNIARPCSEMVVLEQRDPCLQGFIPSLTTFDQGNNNTNKTRDDYPMAASISKSSLRIDRIPRQTFLHRGLSNRKNLRDYTPV